MQLLLLLLYFKLSHAIYLKNFFYPPLKNHPFYIHTNLLLSILQLDGSKIKNIQIYKID